MLEERSRVALILTIAVAAGMNTAFPEVGRLVDGKPIGSGISDVVVGLIVVSFPITLTTIDWASKRLGAGRKFDIWVAFVFLSVVIVVCASLVYFVPDSPEAIGVLIVSTAGIAATLYSEYKGRPIGGTGRESNAE